MLDAEDEVGCDAQFDLLREGLAQRPIKLQVRQAIQRKHAGRSERALHALVAQHDSAAKAP